MAPLGLTGLGPEWVTFLKRLGEVADAHGMKAYVVGGPIRDLLLGLRPTDVDVMVEGDALAFTSYLKQQWAEVFPSFPVPKKPVHYAKFGTAKLLFDEKLFGQATGIDFSTARKEMYPASGSQPVVSPGTLQNDLARRDFSVNAMARAVGPAHFDTLCDSFNGATHVAQKVLAILHEKSFEDDPARLIRGIRFSQRLGFDFDTQTKELFARAVEGGYVNRLPAFRLFDEFKKALSEPHALPILRALQQVGLLSQIHDSAEIAGDLLLPFEGLAGSERIDGNVLLWECRLRAMFSKLDASAMARALQRFALQERRICQLSEVVITSQK